eukprot:jgi/Botrbrau1/11300/Bobra.0038s0063.1
MPKCDAAGPRTPCGQGSGLFAIKPDRTLCENLGCCWSPPPASPATVAAMNLPSCFYANAGSSAYVLKGSLSSKDGVSRGESTLLHGTMPMLGADIQDLSVETKRIAANIVEVKIGSLASPRWEIPKRLFERTASEGEEGDTEYTLEVATKPFEFAVLRKGSNDTVFDTRGQRLVFKNQYLELSTSLEKSTVLYGLGETAPSTGMPLRRDGVPYTLWTHDTWAGMILHE